MHNAIADQAGLRNAILADALGHTVAELRLIEASDMVAYIRADQWPNIADLIQSSAELSFVEGSLSFACSAEYSIGWDSPISISLDMEFQANTVSAFFTLTMGANESLVDIRHMWFASTPVDEEVGTRVFAEALADARLPSSSVQMDQHNQR